MMKALRFELGGKTAFFKKPDVNAHVYFTYSHIHKVALLGMFGAILGLQGYAAQKRSLHEDGEHEANRFPEFYAKLSHLKVCIVPHGDRGYFAKKIQVFNNSVGYASFEERNNLIVREQWLENPCWTIYVLDDCSEMYKRLKEALVRRQSVYIPYLGKNDHPAHISQIAEIDLAQPDTAETIDSLFVLTGVELGQGFKGRPYFYKEFLPVGLDEALNGYVFQEMAFTNQKIRYVHNKDNLFREDRTHLFFF